MKRGARLQGALHRAVLQCHRRDYKPEGRKKPRQKLPFTTHLRQLGGGRRVLAHKLLGRHQLLCGQGIA